MKFGTKISTDLYNEWRPFYLNYNLLKRELKHRTTAPAGWTTKDENEFTVMLTEELDKIHDFQKAKTSELARRIREAEKDVERLVAEELSPDEPPSNRSLSPDPESLQIQPEAYAHDGGSDDDITDDEEEQSDESFDALEERFHGLEEEVAILVADVHDLALYTKLNITGFMKILKKHDKQTNVPLKTSFIQEYLEKRPFYKYNWDALIVKLSKLYDLVRTRGHPVQGDSSAGGNQSAFVRQTTKYWVHPDNLVSLKLAILRNLPVLVFNPDKEYEPKDSAITSIYFDNEELELYLGRLEKTEGAEAVRLRWYGDVDNKTIFVERKTHREDWTGEKSVKARFPLKEHLVNPFLRGEYTVDADFQQLVEKGKKTQQEVDTMIQLANEVQYAVLTKGLKPVVRSFYNRTAFQLPGDARVRISLDTELTLIREDNWDGRSRAGDSWRRTEVGIDFPFLTVSDQDKEIFKYGVLEVKLQTQLGQQPPKWVTDLVQSHLVEAVPKFSKFIHGCATLLPNRVDLVPFWLPQMDVDILKPDMGYLSVIERPSAVLSNPTTKGHSPATTPSSSRRNLSPPASRGSSPALALAAYSEPLSEGEDDDDVEYHPAKDEGKRTGLSGEDLQAALAYREQMLKEKREAEEENQTRDERGKGNEKEPEDPIVTEEGEGQNQGEEANGEHHYHKHPQDRRYESSTLTKKLRSGALSIDPLAPSHAFDETLKTKLQGAQVQEDDRHRRFQNEHPSSSSSAQLTRSSTSPNRSRYGRRNDQTEGNGEDDRPADEVEEEAALGISKIGYANDRILERNVRAPAGKRISIPVRIEPKVYFAAERTFLKWLSNAVFISSIATTLLNFIPPEDTRGLISAALFTFTALLSIAYAAGIFIYRSYKMRERNAEGLYYDKYGPTVLCVVLFLALATNIGLRVSQL